MSWFKVDDKFHDHPKARRAGLAACGLWLRAGSWSADQLTDGFVPDDVLPRWGGRGVDVFALADTLVEVRLWERVDGEDETTSGYRFRKWAKYQPTRAEVEGKEVARSEGGVLGNHRRWHEREGKVDPACPHCVGTESVDRSPTESPARVGPESPRPVPSRPDPSRPSSVDAAVPGAVAPVDNLGLTDDDLDKIAGKINGDHAFARKIAADIIDRAGEPPRKPLAYVLRAIAAEPDRYRRASRVTRETECRTHAGQLATSCAGCRVDALDPSPVRKTQQRAGAAR